MKCPNCDYPEMNETELRDLFRQKTGVVLYHCPKCNTSERRDYSGE